MTDGTPPPTAPRGPAPHVPEPAFPELPGVGGRIGAEPEDFVVDEVIDTELGSEGEHWWVRIRKRGLTTPDAIDAVARASNVRPGDVGSAGMKDKHAVTSQWLSLPKHAKDPAEWALPDEIGVLEVHRHPRKLRTGQLAGNRFRIRLTGVEPDALSRGLALCERLARDGLPNYFGPQRFGSGGQNLGRALEFLSGTGRRDKKRGRFYAKLYPSVIQSEVFNRFLSLRRELGLDRLILGEVVRLEGTRSVFVVDEPERELHRLRERDIHLTGPMPGPKMKSAQALALELEQRAMRDAGLTPELEQALARHVDGTRRDLVVIPEGLELTQPGPGVLELAVFLPSGSYATDLVRELTRAPFFSPRGETPRPAEPGG